MGEVFDRYTDSVGNFHYSDTETGHHVIQMANNYKHTKTVTNNMKVRSLVNIDNNGTFITSGYWESIGYDTYCCSKCGVRYTKPIF